jgi:hypothetical protein
MAPVRDSSSIRPQPFSIRVSEESLVGYKAAAEEAGMSTAEWARHVLDVAAGVKKIRHVYYIDVGSMTPKAALKHIQETGKKIKDGKW